MADTKIDYVDKSWNVISGCSPVSEGCRNCYAKRMAQRLVGRYDYPRDDPFRVTFHPERLNEPLRWKKPKRIFVCSMGDLFHKDVSVIWIEKIFSIIVKAKWHQFLVLTKRPEEAEKIGGWIKNIPNLFLGVSIEDQEAYDERASILSKIECAHRWISFEPLLNPIVTEFLDWRCEWAVCGGETGPHARPLHPDWVRSVRDQCQMAGVPFFFKSWGEWLPVGEKPSGEFIPIGKKDALRRLHLWEDEKGNVSIKVGHKHSGHLIDGQEYRQIPE